MPHWAEFYFDSWLFPELAESKPLKDRTQSAVIVGHFCEHYLMHLLGGKKDDSLGQFGVKPDVMFWTNGMVDFDVILESKGLSRNYGSYITHDQVFRYITMSANSFPLTRPRVFYSMCLHNVTDMTKRCDTEIDLIETLGRNYLGTLIIPLEIIHALLSWMPRRANKGWNTPSHDLDWMTCISGPQIHKVIEGDMDLVEWLTGKHDNNDELGRALPLPDFDQYEVIRWRTPQVRMHGFLVKEAWLCAMLPRSDETPRANELVEEYRAVCLLCESTQLVYKYKGEPTPRKLTLECHCCGRETIHEEDKNDKGI